MVWGWGVALLLVGCAAHRPSSGALPALVGGPHTVSVGTTVGPGDASVVLGDSGVGDHSVCRATRRDGPLWQSLDVGALRVLCLADPSRLRPAEALEQRYQAPVAVSPGSGQQLALVVAHADGPAQRLLDDLRASADPEALRLLIVRGPLPSYALPGGPWGALVLTVAQAPVTLTVDGSSVIIVTEDHTLSSLDRGPWTVTP